MEKHNQKISTIPPPFKLLHSYLWNLKARTDRTQFYRTSPERSEEPNFPLSRHPIAAMSSLNSFNLRSERGCYQNHGRSCPTLSIASSRRPRTPSSKLLSELRENLPFESRWRKKNTSSLALISTRVIRFPRGSGDRRCRDIRDDAC